MFRTRLRNNNSLEGGNEAARLRRCAYPVDVPVLGKGSRRRNSTMSPAAVVLSDPYMQDLNEYFSGQTLTRSTAKTDEQIEGLAQYLASL